MESQRSTADAHEGSAQRVGPPPPSSTSASSPPAGPRGGRGAVGADLGRKRPRVGTLTTSLRSELYSLIVRQLHHDGFLAAAAAVADATGSVVPGIEVTGDRLAKLVCYGLAGERQETRDVRQFAAEQVVERHLSAAKVYVPLQLAHSWSVGRRHFRMRERFTSSSLTNAVRDVCFSPDGSLVAVVGSEGLASVFTLETIEDLSALDEVRAVNRQRGLDGTGAAATVARNNGDGSRPLVPTAGATTRNATEITELARARHYTEHGQSSVEVARFHPTSPLLLTGGRDGTVLLHDYTQPESRVTLKLRDTFPVRAAAFHPSGEYVLYGTDHPAPRLVSVRTGEVLTTPGTYASNSVVIDNQTSYSRFDSRAFSGEGSGSTGGGVGGAAAAAFVSPPGSGATSHAAGLTGAAFSPDGRTLATSSLDGAWILYDGVSGKIVCKVENAHSAVPVTSVAYSRSGQVLLTAGMDSTSRLWDLRRLTTGSGAECELMSFGEPGKCDHRSIRACFSYDESHVLCQDTTLLAVHSHCVYSGQISYSLTTHPAFVQRALAPSPFANLIVTGADDCRLRLWTPSWLP